MMNKLNRNDLYSLEQYADIRSEFRVKVMTHKKNRQLAIGPNVTLYFEDQLIMQYQIQEILKAERIFEAAEIEEELATYNALIPDGTNLKATMMIEYTDEKERRNALAKMIGIEKAVWLQVNNFDKVLPFADEDLTRETDEKTAAVHFLRFELSTAMITALKSGEKLAAGIQHTSYNHTISPIAENIRNSLVNDLD